MLNILCALHCEAQPIIQRLGLKLSTQTTSFPVYENAQARLAISGIGKLSSAAAAGVLGATAKEESCWLNVGIAGHAHHEIGKGILAHKITDQGSRQRFYPEIASYNDFKTGCVTTVDSPIAHYPDDTLYEMEASGFFQTAQRFATVDRIQCFKVISDNKDKPPNKINKAFVQDLIQQSIDPIERLIEKMIALKTEPAAMDTSEFQKHCHWTQTELHQLERLLVRWKAMKIEVPDYQHLTDANTILTYLENTLNQQPLCFTPSTTKTP